MKLTHDDGTSAMLAPDGSLSDDARRAIAGLMDLAPALTAFGNANPTSYFRLVPHQEAPTNICWGDRNRSVLVRVPLGWTAKANMCAAANGAKRATPCDDVDSRQKQTFEIRSADCSADIYQLIAGLAVAVRHGFEMPDALEVAGRQYVDIDIHKPENAAKLASLPTLPANCPASADCLEAREGVFEEYGVFPAGALKAVEKRLRSFDSDRYARALGDPELMLEIVREHFYCGLTHT